MKNTEAAFRWIVGLPDMKGIPFQDVERLAVETDRVDMKLRDLTPEQIDKLCAYRYDRIVEKHEGPWDWEGSLKYQNPEFLQLCGRDVLLPLDKKHHPNISILRCIASKDEDVLTIFLKDTTYYSGIDSGFLAVCERVPGESWFLATVYHEWYLTDYRKQAKG